MPARAVGVRPLAPSDLDAVRVLFARDAGAVPARYFARARETLEDFAAGRPGPLALVAEADELLGAFLGGEIAGSEGAAAITAVSVALAHRRNGVGSTLVRAGCDLLRARGARVVIAELAGDPALAAAQALLEACGFAEGGRVSDLYAAGVDLIVLERRFVD